MGTSLTGSTIGSTYSQLLHVDGGVNSTLKTVYDGDGTATALKVSSQSLGSDKPLDISAATAGQIAFPATQNQSADPNTLDDYEENTWSPVIAFGGASVGVTYTAQIGKYTKIGNVVHFQVSITLSNKGSSTGAVTISLPFASGSTNDVVAMMQFTSATTAAADSFAAIGNSSSTIAIYVDRNVTTAPVALTNTSVSNTSVFKITGHFFV